MVYSRVHARVTDVATGEVLRVVEDVTGPADVFGVAPSAMAGAMGARAGLFEVGQVRVHPTGSVTVYTGAHSTGQGHETAFAQIVAEGLGIGIDEVEIVHGDTGKIPFGMGTYGSRSLAVGGSAIYAKV